MEFALSNTQWLDALTPPLETHLFNLWIVICRLLNSDGRPKPDDTPETEYSDNTASRYAILEINSEPPGANVAIDGAKWEVKTPDALKRVPWGRHHYKAVLEGETQSSHFDVLDYVCQITIDFPLAKQRLAKEREEQEVQASPDAEIRHNDDGTDFESRCRMALETREQVLGPEHPDTLRSVNRLARVLHHKGDYANAELLFRRAIEACGRVLGPMHPDTLKSVYGLARVLYHKGDYVASETLFRQTLATREQVLGLEHPDTLESVYGLARLLHRKDDHAGAEMLYRRALEGLLNNSKPIGHTMPVLIPLICNYADCLLKQGRSRDDIRNVMGEVLRPIAMSCATDDVGHEPAKTEPSSKLRAVIKELLQDPSKGRELTDKLQREDPALMMELLKWIIAGVVPHH